MSEFDETEAGIKYVVDRVYDQIMADPSLQKKVKERWKNIPDTKCSLKGLIYDQLQSVLKTNSIPDYCGEAKEYDYKGGTKELNEHDQKKWIKAIYNYQRDEKSLNFNELAWDGIMSADKKTARNLVPKIMEGTKKFL